MAGFYRSSLKQTDNKFRLAREFSLVDDSASEENIQLMYREIREEARGEWTE